MHLSSRFYVLQVPLEKSEVWLHTDGRHVPVLLCCFGPCQPARPAEKRLGPTEHHRLSALPHLLHATTGNAIPRDGTQGDNGASLQLFCDDGKESGEILAEVPTTISADPTRQSSDLFHRTHTTTTTGAGLRHSSRSAPSENTHRRFASHQPSLPRPEK